jgi:hypothetical protein
MRAPLRNNLSKKRFPRLPGYLSITFSLFVLLFLSISSTGDGLSLWPSLAEAQGPERVMLKSDHPLIREAIEAQHRHMSSLHSIPDVVGTGVGVGADGLPVIKVFTKRAGVRGIPEWLESIPVHVEVTGMVVALGDTTARYRPAPIGVSTGHPAITAGTIGARVKDSNDPPNVYALSNNHVYANGNDALIGDPELQPGAYDGGKDPADRIGTLFDFQIIDYSFSGVNYIDAALALSSTEALGNATLLDGYGTPGSVPVEASVNMPVQKYGRTTSLTHGTVSAINVFVEVCYEQWLWFCIKSAYFYDQIQISPAGFSAGGDSGSLIVTDDANKNPVGLLFAGSDTTTFANRIQRVLDRFSVNIDAEAGPPPEPLAAPSGLTATAGSSSQINLAWTDNSSNETGFKIERCTGTGCSDFAQIATVGANVTTYQNTGLTADTTYRYQVRAYNAGGDSDYSNVAEAAILAPPPLPNAPSNLRATAVSRSQINLAWTDNSSNESGFKIERCKGANCTNFSQIATVGETVTTYSNTGLARNTTYKYRVRAYNQTGNSGYSNVATATTPR